MIASTPKPPYYAVIFTSIRTEGDNGYSETAERMLELAKQQPGFLGAESARNDIGINNRFVLERPCGNKCMERKCRAPNCH